MPIHSFSVKFAAQFGNKIFASLSMDKDNVRTVAFQVPTELFEQLKAYLKRNGIKQNAFFLDCIQQALAEDAGVGEE